MSDTKLPYADSENYRRLLAMIDPTQQSWDLSAPDVKAIGWAIDALEVFARKAEQDQPFAYVSLKSCGCIGTCMTREYADTLFKIEGLNDQVLRGHLKPVGMDEFNRLTMKCDSCYRK